MGVFGACESGPRDRALSASRHCLDAYKSDFEKDVTRPHRAPVAQNRIGGSNPRAPTLRPQIRGRGGEVCPRTRARGGELCIFSGAETSTKHRVCDLLSR